MTRFICALALISFCAVAVFLERSSPAQYAQDPRPGASQTVTIINTDYTLVSARKAPSIGELRASGVFLILTFQVANQSKGPRRLMLAESTLEDDEGAHYGPSFEGMGAAMRTYGTVTTLLSDYDIAPHARETLTMVFDVSDSARRFTIGIRNPNTLGFSNISFSP